jgi:hypothetical protein
MNDNETLFKQAQNLIEYDTKEAEEKLLELRKTEETPEKNYLISKLLIDFGTKTGEVKYFDEAIGKLKKLNESDFNRIPFYLGTAYMKKYETIDEKPNLIDSKNILYKSKLELKKFISENPDEDLHNAYVNLGFVYSKLGRTIESLEIYEFILEKYGSDYGLFNTAYGLTTYSEFSANPKLCIKKAYNIFKTMREDDNLKRIFREKSENMMNYILEDYDEEFLEEEIEEDENIEIIVESDFESFMVEYNWENKLTLNFCEFCQNCPKFIEDSLVIEKMVYPTPDENNETLFSKFSSYLNQIKMEYISARTMLILSENEEFDLDSITRHVYMVDTDFSEANDIRIQFLKDSFKNFFNILDKIAVFIKNYLNVEYDDKEIDFTNVWFKPGLKEKFARCNNAGATALFDIYCDLEFDYNKKYLRDTRNALTHRYLKITHEKQEITDKTVEELKNETLEIAHLSKNAIIYLMRFVKINEEYQEEKLDIEFIPTEEVEY